MRVRVCVCACVRVRTCALTCCDCEQVNEKGGLLVTGFQDGVVRLLELCDSQSLNALAGSGDADLRLKQALKPHNAPVTAIAYDRNGAVLATGVRPFEFPLIFKGKRNRFSILNFVLP